MIVDCAYYLDGRRSDVGPMSLQEAAARAGQGGFVWLGLFEPDAAELAQVRSVGEPDPDDGELLVALAAGGQMTTSSSAVLAKPSARHSRCARSSGTPARSATSSRV